MNTKRLTFWITFFAILALIVWGMIVAMNKPVKGTSLGSPAPVTSTDHVVGPANAPVTIIEYSDFQCPACEQYYGVVSRLMLESSTTVRLVYRQFPLAQHPNAIPAAMASEAAGAQGKFWGMYDQLFTNHTDWTELPDPTSVFVGYAKHIGLDEAKFKQDLASSTLRNAILAEEAEGVSLGIDQTPTFFVNGKAIVNPQGYDEFKTIIDAAARAGSN